MPIASKIPMAIGRSNPTPSLPDIGGRTIDGDRFVGVAKAGVKSADLMCSRLNDRHQE